MPTISLTLNGCERSADVPGNLTLAALLRDEFGLLGTKVACDQGVCGACTVLLDDLPVTACTMLAAAVDRHAVTSIEGVAPTGGLGRVQQALYEKSVPQCGFCIPGMVMLAEGLRRQDPRADPATVDAWMSANICRCSGYLALREALAEVFGAP